MESPAPSSFITDVLHPAFNAVKSSHGCLFQEAATERSICAKLMQALDERIPASQTKRVDVEFDFKLEPVEKKRPFAHAKVLNMLLYERLTPAAGSRLTRKGPACDDEASLFTLDIVVRDNKANSAPQVHIEAKLERSRRVPRDRRNIDFEKLVCAKLQNPECLALLLIVDIRPDSVTGEVLELKTISDDCELICIGYLFSDNGDLKIELSERFKRYCKQMVEDINLALGKGTWTKRVKTFFVRSMGAAHSGPLPESR